MQKRRLTPLSLPGRGKIASVCLVALFSVIFSVTTSAQTDGNGLPDYTEQLGAIITAIESLPDYTKQLEAIAAAVEVIPDYSNKFDAIQTALAAIAENLTAIDVSNAPNLIELQVQNNELKSLDVSKNPNLKSLDCSENQLTSLLVSDKVVGGFEYLLVYQNKLSEAVITDLIKSMPEATNSIREFYLKYDKEEDNEVKNSHVSAAKDKGYKVYFRNGSDWVEK